MGLLHLHVTREIGILQTKLSPIVCYKDKWKEKYITLVKHSHAQSPVCGGLSLYLRGGGGRKGTVKGLHSGATRCCGEQWNWQCNFGQNILSFFCWYCHENGNRGRKWRPLRLTEISGGPGSSVALCNNRPTLQYLSHFVKTFVALCNKKNLSHFVIEKLLYFAINLKWMIGGQEDPGIISC